MKKNIKNHPRCKVGSTVSIKVGGLGKNSDDGAIYTVIIMAIRENGLILHRPSVNLTGFVEYRYITHIGGCIGREIEV